MAAKAREEYPPISKLNEFNFFGKVLAEGKQSASPLYESQESANAKHIQRQNNFVAGFAAPTSVRSDISIEANPQGSTERRPGTHCVSVRKHVPAAMPSMLRRPS